MSKQAETEATTQAKHYVFKGGKEIMAYPIQWKAEYFI